MTSAPSPDDLATWLDTLVDTAAEATGAFEARLESQASASATWEGGEFGSFNESRLAGLCLRVWVDDAAGFASCHTFSRPEIQSMVDEAVALARANASKRAPSFPYEPAGHGAVTYRPDIARDPIEADPAEIASPLERAHDQAVEAAEDGYARSSLASSRRHVLFENADGRRADSVFQLSTLQVQAAYRGGPRLAEGTAWEAGERGLEGLARDGLPEALGETAAERAQEASVAKPVPAGRQRVLCDPVLSGLLAHESFGHLTEYDLVEMGWSLLADRQGQRFADEQVSIVDAPVAPDPRQGIRLPYDEEGTEGSPVRLLDQGRLAAWMHQRGSAPLSQQPPTGNARAKNVRFPPIVRMRNTYFEPGEWSKEEALEALGDGVYLIEGRGGAPASDGSFLFTAVRGYLVEDGEIRHPLRSTTISGNILSFLSGIEAVTDEVSVTTTNFGGCGKWGQAYIPVGMGGPHVLVKDALVGGQAR